MVTTPQSSFYCIWVNTIQSDFIFPHNAVASSAPSVITVSKYHPHSLAVAVFCYLPSNEDVYFCVSYLTYQADLNIESVVYNQAVIVVILKC